MPKLLAYALLFTGIGAFFIFLHLMIGKLVRPKRPDAEKLTIYECGEPTVGSAWVQFDLRFYVVALLFVIFDVEMAFFFPWAVVFGKANTLAKVDIPAEERLRLTGEMMPRDRWTQIKENVPPGTDPQKWQEFENSLNSHTGPLRAPDQRADKDPNVKPGSVTDSAKRAATPVEQTRDAAESFAWFAFLDILVFFGVLLVGFAYLWRRGDLDWVRSIAAQRSVVRDQKSEASLVTSEY